MNLSEMRKSNTPWHSDISEIAPHIAYDHQPPLLSGQPEKGISVMGSVVHRFCVRVRALLAFITNPVERFVRMKIQARGYGSQRMCPFCRLITSRYKSCCLECGKSFKPA